MDLLLFHCRIRSLPVRVIAAQVEIPSTSALWISFFLVFLVCIKQMQG